MTTTEWFTALPRGKRKDLLTWLHDARRDARKNTETLRLLTELILKLEADHHTMND
jgi:hypothetical protein